MKNTTDKDKYDSPWKEGIELYFKELMEFYFPEIAGKLTGTENTNSWTRSWRALYGMQKSADVMRISWSRYGPLKESRSM